MMKIDVFFLKRNDFSIVKVGRACVQKKKKMCKRILSALCR